MPIPEIVQTAEIEAFERAAAAVISKLPKEKGIPLMAVDELRKKLSEKPKD